MVHLYSWTLDASLAVSRRFLPRLNRNGLSVVNNELVRVRGRFKSCPVSGRYQYHLHLHAGGHSGVFPFSLTNRQSSVRLRPVNWNQRVRAVLIVVVVAGVLIEDEFSVGTCVYP